MTTDWTLKSFFKVMNQTPRHLITHLLTEVYPCSLLLRTCTRAQDCGLAPAPRWLLCETWAAHTYSLLPSHWDEPRHYSIYRGSPCGWELGSNSCRCVSAWCCRRWCLCGRRGAKRGSWGAQLEVLSWRLSWLLSWRLSWEGLWSCRRMRQQGTGRWVQTGNLYT